MRNVREGSVSVVVVKDDSPPIGYEQIIISVVVIISDAAPLTPSRSKQSSFFRYVSKGPVAVIAKQGVRRLVFRRDAFKPRPIDKEQVQPAIVVVVEKSDAATNFFQEIALVRNTAKNVGCIAYARLSGDVREIKTRRGFRTGSRLLNGR